jgi:hypothetical protein
VCGPFPTVPVLGSKITPTKTPASVSCSQLHRSLCIRPHHGLTSHVSSSCIHFADKTVLEGSGERPGLPSLAATLASGHRTDLPMHSGP